MLGSVFAHFPLLFRWRVCVFFFFFFDNTGCDTIFAFFPLL